MNKIITTIAILFIAYIPVFGKTITTIESTNAVVPKSPELLLKEKCQAVEDIKVKVSCYAEGYNVPDELAHYIVQNESRYIQNEVGDEDIICPMTGRPVYARGLMQITRCYHPELSDSQAFDPDENLNYGMKLAATKKSCISQFSTCSKYYSIN